MPRDAWRERTPIQQARALLQRLPTWQAAQDHIHERLLNSASQREKNYWGRTLGELRKLDAPNPDKQAGSK